MIKLCRYFRKPDKQAKFVSNLCGLVKEVRSKSVISITSPADVQKERCRYGREGVEISLFVPVAEAFNTEAGLKACRPRVKYGKAMLQS